MTKRPSELSIGWVTRFKPTPVAEALTRVKSPVEAFQRNKFVPETVFVTKSVAALRKMTRPPSAVIKGFQAALVPPARTSGASVWLARTFVWCVRFRTNTWPIEPLGTASPELRKARERPSPLQTGVAGGLARFVGARNQG